MNVLKDLVATFNEFPVIIQIMWALVVLFFFVLIELTVHLKLLRKRLRKHHASRLKFQNEYESLLVNYLYASDENGELSAVQKEINAKIKAGLFKSYKRKIFIKVMIKLMNEISGELTDNLNQLYRDLGFVQFAKSKLRHEKWNVIAIGIRDLRYFKIEEVADDITKFINHPRKEIRREAHLYFLNVFNFQGLDFLNKLETPLSEWDQIGYFGILQNFDQQEIPDLSQWLYSKNDYVVLFTLNLVKIYNRMETKDNLMDLLNHENHEIRSKSIQLLNYFYVFEAKPELLKRYSSFTEVERLEVFKFLENMGDESDVEFISEHVKEASFNIKLIGLKILKRFNEAKFINLKVHNIDANTEKIIQFLEVDS